MFFVVSNVNRNVILGRDFLQDNGVRLYLNEQIKDVKTFIDDVHSNE